MHASNEQSATGVSRELLTFTLGSEEYGIDILKVQEIRGYEAVTTIANAPDFIKGVINLRGIIVPVVDMRIKFKLGSVTYDETTVVIILNVADRVVGMVVDGVSDVTTLKADEIKPAPEFGAGLICSGFSVITSETPSTTMPTTRFAMLRMMTTVVSS